MPKDDEANSKDRKQQSQLLRVVVDTNVFVSGIINPSGPPGKILQALRRRQFMLISSPSINEEILEVLSRPRLQKYGLQDSLFDIGVILYTQAELIQEKTKLQVSADPDDDKFLAAAIDGKAQYVVTGDKSDLLSLGEYQYIPIISCRAFLRVL